MAIWVAIKGSIFDVSGNNAYAEGGAYHRMYIQLPRLSFACMHASLFLPHLSLSSSYLTSH